MPQRRSKVRFAPFFFGKKNIRLLPCSSSFAKRLVRVGYSLASALISPLAHYHLFARFSPFNAHFCFSLVRAKFALLRFSLSRKSSACFLAPPLSQKGSFTSAIRLQAHSFRLWLTYHLFARFSPFNAHFCFSLV